VILLGSSPKPFRRLHLIFCHAFASGIQETQIILRLRISLLGSFANPGRRRHHILRHTLALA